MSPRALPAVRIQKDTIDNLSICVSDFTSPTLADLSSGVHFFLNRDHHDSDVEGDLNLFYRLFSDDCCFEIIIQ